MLMIFGKYREEYHLRSIVRVPGLTLSLGATLLLSFTLTLASVAHAGLERSEVTFHSLSLSDSKGETKLTYGALRSEGTMSSAGRNMSWRFRFVHLRPTGYLQWGSPSADLLSDVPSGGKLSGRSSIEDESVELTGALEDSHKRLKTALTWKWRNAGRSDVSATVWLKPLESIGVGGKLAHLRLLPSFSDIFYDFRDLQGSLSRVGGRVSWRSPATVRELRLKITPVERLSIASRFTRAGMKPNIPVQGASDPGTYVGVIDGTWSVTGVDISYGADGSRYFATSYKRIAVDTRLQAFDGGREFADFGVVSASAGLFSLTFETPAWSIRAGAGALQGDFAGTLEAWPFLNGLLSVIGERRHFVGDGQIAWQYMSLNRPVVRTSSLTLQTSLNYLHLSPDLRFSSWRPVFLGFGKGDLREGRLDLKSADLLQLRLGPTWRWNNLLVDVAVSQWIPLSIHRFRQQQSDSGQSDGDASVALSKRHSAGNGLGISLNLKAEF